MSYQETVAALRQAAAEREMREKTAEAEAMLEEVRYNENSAAELEQQGDRQGALNYAALANDAARDLNEMLAKLPQRQELSPAKQAYLSKHREFIEKHGAKAYEAIGHCHNYATRPKNPGTNDPSRTGMGLADDSPEYFEAISSLLEMYGKDAGLRFEPEGSLTPNEAAQISGISGREWNLAAERMVSEGHDSGSLYGRQWSRKTG